MANRVLLGNMGSSEYGLRISESGVDVITASLNQLLFDSQNPIGSLPIYKIYDITVSGGSESGGIMTPGTYTATHTSGGLGFIPVVAGFHLISTQMKSDYWIITHDVSSEGTGGSSNLPSNDGFTWEVTESTIKVNNYNTSQRVFRIFLFDFDVSGGSAGTNLGTPTVSETSGYRSHDGFRVSWNTISGASNYRLDVATDSSFTTFPTLDQTYNNYSLTATERIISSANASTTYYVRVRAESASDISPDSTPIAITTDATTAPSVVISGASTIYQDGSSYTPTFTVSNGGVSCTTTFTNNKGATNPSSISNTQEGTALSSRTFTNIPRSSTSGTYTVQADFADTSPGSDTVDVVRPAISLPTTLNIGDTEITPTDAFSGIRIVEGATNRGYLQTSTTSQGTGYSNHTNAIQPNNDSAVNLYWIRYTSLTGSLSTSPSMSVNTWYQMTQTREWYVQRTNDTAGSNQATFTLEIAASSGGTVIDSSSVTLDATVSTTPADYDVSTLTGDVLHANNIRFGAGTSTSVARVNFETDGTVSVSRTGNANPGGDDTWNGTEWWDASPDTGVGTGKYIRLTASGSGGTISTDASSWTELSAQRSIQLTTSITSSSDASQTNTRTITVEFSDSSGGTPVETSTTFTLKAQASISVF